MVQGVDPAELQRHWGAFDPGNVGSYPGRVERVLPGAKEETILDIRETDDRGVSLITAMLSVSPGGSRQTLRTPFCHLSWGVSGGRDEAVIDFLHGQVITVAGTFLRITASFPLGDNVNPPGMPPTSIDGEVFGGPTSPFLDPTAAKEQSLLLGASVAPNPHPIAGGFGASPRLTTFHLVPAAGESDFIPIPSHAQSVTLLGTFATGDITSIAAFTIPTAGATLYQTANPAPNLDQFAFPIARGVDFIRLTNGTGAEILALLFWTIGL